MQTFGYAARLAPDPDDGGCVVTFRDFPEAISQGDTVEQATWEALDCLEEAIANRIAMGLPIPDSSQPEPGEHRIALRAQMAAKAALYRVMAEEHLTKVELARRLKCDEAAVRRLLDPLHPSELPAIESALAALGRQLVVSLKRI